MFGRYGVGDVQLLQNICNFCRVQKVQLLQVGLCALPLQLGAAGQGVVQTGVGKGLVVGVRAGVDDGDPGARSGISGGPGGGGADHFRGSGHIRIGGVCGDHVGRVPGFQDDLFHTGQRGNLFHLPVFHLGGDEIGRQGQIPDNIQRFAGDRLNLCGDLVLTGLQFLAVRHRSGVPGNIFRVEACFQGGGLLQHDGYADQLRIRRAWRGGRIADLGFLERSVHGGAVRLLEGERGGVCAHSPDGDCKAAQHGRNQQPGEETGGRIRFFHTAFSFVRFWGKRPGGACPSCCTVCFSYITRSRNIYKIYN